MCNPYRAQKSKAEKKFFFFGLDFLCPFSKIYRFRKGKVPFVLGCNAAEGTECAFCILFSLPVPDGRKGEESDGFGRCCRTGAAGLPAPPFPAS